MDSSIQEEKEFVESVYSGLFSELHLECVSESPHQISYGKERFSIDFHFDSRYGRMVYGGMYLSFRDREKPYRLNELVEFHDSEKRKFADITKPFREKNQIDLRTHLAVIESHLLELLRSGDMSWEAGFKGYLASKFPY